MGESNERSDSGSDRDIILNGSDIRMNYVFYSELSTSIIITEIILKLYIYWFASLISNLPYMNSHIHDLPITAF